MAIRLAPVRGAAKYALVSLSLRTICAVAWGTIPLAAQTVAGRVVDAETGAGVASVRILLLRADGAQVAEVTSRADGSFQVGALRAGDHRIEARHIGYATTLTPLFRIDRNEVVAVDIRLMAGAIQLEPLTITGRRRDVRHDATHEGFYARHATLPPIGNARAISRTDAEMINARDARDVMAWLPRPHCLVVYWNGHMAASSEQADVYLETLQIDLEGIEFYRYIQYAPATMRNFPAYLIECTRHSMIALWTRTGYFADPAPELRPSRRRVSVGPTLYHLAGARAPATGVGAEALSHWRVGGRTAVGVSVRRTTHTLPASVAEALLPPVIAPLYAMPPGARPLTLWGAGVELRTASRQRGGAWPVVAGRMQLMHRSFTLQSSSASGHAVRVTSTGFGAGLTIGAETIVRGRVALHAALGHDRLFFGRYSEIGHRTNPTSAHWGGTQLRLGAGYPLPR